MVKTIVFVFSFQPKLTPAKCRRNVDNFLEACRKIGVHRVSKTYRYFVCCDCQYQ